MIDFMLGQIFVNLLLVVCWMIVLLIVLFVMGGLVGFGLFVMCVLGLMVLCGVVKFYIEVFQGILLLMQLFIVFFGLLFVGFDVLLWVVVMVGFMFFISVYLVEIWCGCVEVVLKGQWEVLVSLVMSYVE